MKSFLFGCRQHVKIRNIFSDWLMVLRGLPPGSVLGPLLFNIFVNYLNFCVTKYNVNAYADDNQLHFSCECPAAIETAINEDLKESMYNSLILSHLNNCSMVWHSCLKSDSDKLEKLHEHALQSFFQDKENYYQYLLNRANKTTLYNHRLQNISILICKALNNVAPSDIKDLFTTHNTNYQLRGSNILSLPRIHRDFKSIRYFGSKIWNFLDDNLRTQPDLQSLKKFVRHINFNN